ncbi:unnamed protein product [Coregonus sp. 'balchen']|nr:unnamed protein product [Coregonus sp. 'balchen']
MSRRNMTSVEVSWPVPMRAIGAQNLLTMPGGPLRYLIIHKGCVYYFKSSTSPAPQGAFSLNGYNRVMRAAEETTSSNVFPFKIVHFSKKHRTWYFSAANSFYGSIECPMDITHAPDDPEGNYMLEDEEDDEDDYEKPDSPATSTGRPTVPPPSYPPPPVPCQFRMESMSGFCKGLPPPVPAPNRSTTSPLPKKPPAPLPPPKLGEVSHNQHGHKDIPNKGPPRPPPTHLKPSSERSAWSPKSPIPPPPPMASLKMQAMMGQISISTIPGGKHKDRMPPVPVTLQSPATLSICSDLERKMVLHSSPSPPGCRGNNPSHIPSMPNHCLSSRPAPDLPPQALPALNHTKPGLYKPPLVPKLPCPAVKPKLPRGSAQRSSPDGQSFRTTVDEVLVVWDVSVCKARNYRLFEEDSRVFLELEMTFPSLSALVEHYHSHPLPNHGSLCLQKPYGYIVPR